MSAVREVVLLNNYKPISAALDFHRSRARFVSLCCGARSGKSYAAVHEVVKRIGQDRMMKRGRLKYWFCAPTFQLTKIQEEYLREILPEGFGHWRATDRIMHLPIDVEITFRSTDKPLNLVAVGLDGVWIDEAARVKRDAWQGQLRQRLTDRRGWGLFTSTSLGRNWFYRDLVCKSPSAGGENKDYDFFSWFTSQNDSIPGIAEEVALARAELPRAYFQREYEASFDSFLGQIYEEWDESVHIWKGPHPAYHDVHYSFDPGFRHHGVLLVWLHLNTPRPAFLCVREVAETGKTPDWWCNKAHELQAEWGDGPVIFDPSRPELKTMLAERGIRGIRANNVVNAGIGTVATMLHPASFQNDKGEMQEAKPLVQFHESCRLVREQMPAYRWSDNELLEIPIKENDDAPDAIRYGLHRETVGVKAA